MTTPSEQVAAAPYGKIVQISPLIRRVLAKNPSPFTYVGTGTYIIGAGQTVAVIDPGPDEPAHIEALIAAVAGVSVSHIVITHTHRDHSPAAPAFKAATGAQIFGCIPLVLFDDGPRADAGFDETYTPDHILVDGESISGPDWTLTALHTPGHTSNHLCYTLEQEKALFTGDHVMGWSTTVVAPPDGDMADYMASLRLLLELDHRVYYPTHGDPVTEPHRFVRGLITHRKQRENQILKLLADAPHTIQAMVAVMYAKVDPRLHPAAGRSVLAHLIDLRARGVVVNSSGNWQLCTG
jgi:glyoxylase-like metal-dependent hydrolase (beta-lactamase superfamily II)